MSPASPQRSYACDLRFIYLALIASVTIGCSSPDVARYSQDASINVVDASVKFADGGGAYVNNDDDAGCGIACPATIPTGACEREGLVCEYGDAATASCDPFVVCTNGAWAMWPAQSGCDRCDQPAECPPTFDSGVDCNGTRFRCAYPEGRCACDPTADAGVAWGCAGPSSDCPPQRPRFGSACNGSAQCNYGGNVCSDLLGDYMACECGAWMNTLLVMPPCVATDP